jgi:tryptophan-rich sensory protein
MKKLNYIFALLGFLFINFAGLALGSAWTNPGVDSDWYSQIIKAPWTPPGFVFGLSWTTIMICLSFFMTNLYERRDSSLSFLLLISWILNVTWNPLFFYLKYFWVASLVITALTIVLGMLIHKSRKSYKFNWVLLLPYFIWLNIASSLNIFISIMN